VRTVLDWARVAYGLSGGNPVDGHEVPVPHFGVVLPPAPGTGKSEKIVLLKFPVSPIDAVAKHPRGKLKIDNQCWTLRPGVTKSGLERISNK
jgi:hypothetical protein